MKHPFAALAFGAVALVAIAGFGGFWWARHSMTQDAAQAPAATAPPAARKILYWHDPLVPLQRFDKPGKSPFMDMELVPVYGDDGNAAAGVNVSAQLAQNLGVRTAIAEKASLESSVEAVGAIAFDERAVAIVQSRTAGYVEELFVRAPLDPVRRGQSLVRLFVPDWAGAQHEYLALKSSGEATADLARAARNRLALLGMSEAQIAAVDRDGTPVTHVTLAAPIDGVVAELGARQGMNVMPGATLFRINGLGTVWVNLEVPETQAAIIRAGAAVVATVPAYPGERFPGKISAVLPEVNAATRTVRARVELSNPAGKLKPGMFATVAVAPGKSREAVLVPTEAVIVTGERSVVVVDRGGGRFEPVDAVIGREEHGRTEILKGVEAGARVVVSGQFLIDSEANLRGAGRRMSAEAPVVPPIEAKK
jgi:Cu(I)/Ag(I) efflux system membrane fusion protein